MGDIKPLTIFKFILGIIIGVGLAYFWSVLRPADPFEWLAGVGISGGLAAFVVLYFMGKSG
ncbi:hypothetical protein JXB01_04115 [Candidatus Micrarchaeota archaeon]|nr:hypothetical protein [Candidatus Micrarchaeota archaeon]